MKNLGLIGGLLLLCWRKNRDLLVLSLFQANNQNITLERRLSVSEQQEQNKVAVVIVAHPDDAEFGSRHDS